jgi:hypothetical protein
MAKLRQTLLRCVSSEKVRQAEAKLFQLFMEGDTTAARIWMDHVLGKPLASVEIEEPQGPRLSLSLLLAAIREAVPDPEAQYRIAAVLARMGREAAGDGPSDDRPGQPRLSPPVPASHEHHHVCGNVNSR